MTQGFRVVLTGAVLAGHDAKDVRERIAQAFRLSPPQLDTVFSGRRVSVKRDASQAEAQQLLDRIRALGLSAEIEAMPDTAPALAPVAAPAVAPAAALPTIAAASSGDELFSLGAPAPAEAPKPAPSPVPPLTAAPSGDVTLTTVEEVTCPQCSDIQPKRTLCRSCGVDMPRLRAAREELLREAREARNTGPRTTMSTSGPRTTMTSLGPGSPLSSAEEDTPIVGFGFSGRFNRSTYIAAGLFSVAAMFVLMTIAAFGNMTWLAGLASVAAVIYGIRCIVLRLHDMGRTGWLSLLMLIPVVNFLLSVLLVFQRGSDGGNEHGDEQSGGGAKLVGLSIAMLVMSSGVMIKAVQQNPVAWMALGQEYGTAQARDDASGEDVEYAADNEIVMYSMAGCLDCAMMRTWLQKKGLRYSDYAIDSDPRAADRLADTLAAHGVNGSWRLPIVEVNGELLPNSPTLADVRAKLKAN